MKYIRTKDGSIYEVIKENDRGFVVEDFFDTDEPPYCKSELIVVLPNWVYKQSDTIEELCDEFDIIIPAHIYRYGIYHARYEGWGDFKRDWRDFKEKKGDDYRNFEILGAYGAIWTSKGLIYVAKLNEKGELELL